MSIASEITRLQSAKSDLKTSIENKGVTVPSATTLDGYAALVDQISGGGGGGGLEYETGTWTPASDTARGTITFSNTHTNPPAFYGLSDATGTIDSQTYTNMFMMGYDSYRFTGVGFPYSTTEYRYGAVFFMYRGKSTTSLTNGNSVFQYNSDNTRADNNAYPRYWATPTELHPYTSSTSRYWRAGRTYKWIAIWV